MLLLFTCATLTLVDPAVCATSPACDTVKSQDQDTLARKSPELSRQNSVFREHPAFTTGTELDRLFGRQTDQAQFAAIVDSLLKDHPDLRGPLLRQLLIPPAVHSQVTDQSRLDKFNQQLFDDSKVTPFERMSLIARRYATYHTTATSLRDYQIDVVGTIIWLSEVLK